MAQAEPTASPASPQTLHTCMPWRGGWAWPGKSSQDHARSRGIGPRTGSVSLLGSVGLLKGRPRAVQEFVRCAPGCEPSRDPFAEFAGFAGSAGRAGIAVASRPGTRLLSLLGCSLSLLGLLGSAIASRPRMHSPSLLWVRCARYRLAHAVRDAFAASAGFTGTLALAVAICPGIRTLSLRLLGSLGRSAGPAALWPRAVLESARSV